MTSPPFVAVIILNWNGWRDTLECIRSLQHSSHPAFRILVVDNGSTDDSASHIRRLVPDVELIETKKNLGFAQGNNAGISHVLHTWLPDYIWLLNNDTVVHSTTMAELASAGLTDTGVGVIGSRIVGMDDQEVQEWGGKRAGLWTGLLWPANFQRPPNFISGASMFLRRECLLQCGPFDPEYFFYMEDVDLCFRIARKGWKIAVVDGAVVRHKGSASIGAKGYMQAYWYRRGLIRFLRSHAPLPWLPILATTAARLLLATASRNWSVVQGTWRGFRDGLAG